MTGSGGDWTSGKLDEGGNGAVTVDSCLADSCSTWSNSDIVKWKKKKKKK